MDSWGDSMGGFKDVNQSTDQLSLSVQVPNNDTLPNINLRNYYPKPNFRIIGAFDP